MRQLHSSYSLKRIQIYASFTRAHRDCLQRQGKVVMKRVKRIYAAVLFAAASFLGCQQAFAECGIASTYSSGSRTANGEHYNHMGISAAHKSLPFGTRVIVRNQRTGRSIQFVLTTGDRLLGAGSSICPRAQERAGHGWPRSRVPRSRQLWKRKERLPQSRATRTAAGGECNPASTGPRESALRPSRRRRLHRVHYRVRHGRHGHHRRQYASNED